MSPVLHTHSRGHLTSSLFNFRDRLFPRNLISSWEKGGWREEQSVHCAGVGGDGQHCPLKSLQESLIDSTTPHSQASQEMERNTHHQRSLPSNEDRTNGPLETLL